RRGQVGRRGDRVGRRKPRRARFDPPVPRAFDRLAEGIAALRVVRANYPVSARCVLQHNNFRDLPNIVAAAHEIGLNRISFMSADVSSTAFNRPEPWEQPRVAEVALDRTETA